MKRRFLSILLVTFVAPQVCSQTEEIPRLELTEAFPAQGKFKLPLRVGHHSTDPDVYYVVEQDGLTIEDTTFEANEATVTGGGAAVAEVTDAVFESVVFVDNIASGWDGAWGGGLLVGQSDGLTLSNSSFSRNSATTSGGALYLEGADDARIEDTTFASNSASWGGSTYLSASASVDFDDNTHTGNDAWQGGGVYVAESSDVWLVDETIRSNSAEDAGGGLYCESSELYTTSVSLSGNDPDQAACDSCTGDCESF